MKRMCKIALIIIFSSILLVTNTYAKTNKDDEKYIFNLKRDILVLMISYPNFIKSIEKDESNLVYIVLNNGKKILYDDKINRSCEEKFYKTDIEDTLEQRYPLEKINGIADSDQDPGRRRQYEFLGEIYGKDRVTIERNLIYVPTYYGSIMFNKVNSASDNIQKALNDVGKLVERNSKVGEYVSPLSGTYNYRVIQDTGQLSPHAYGIAIDLVRNDADYWKWGKKDIANKRINDYPEELVKIFEENGFVWGGKWAHFDILHFEYRPEIILKAKYFNDYPVEKCKYWYEGAPRNSEIKERITLIDNAIDN